MKKTPVLPRIAAMHGYTPGEQPEPGRFLKLNTNENPYPPSPKVAAAVAAAAEPSQLRLYPAPLGDAVRARAAACYGLRPEQVIVGNGSDDVLAICLRACAGQGEEVAYTVPTYFVYRSLVDGCGAVRKEFPDPADGSIPAALFESQARVKFVCSPASPFGHAVDPEQIAALAERSDGLVVADEAYVDFAQASALPLLAKHDNLIVIRSFSKSFSLAGARLGLGLASAELISELIKVKDSYNVSRLSLAAGAAALDDMEWMRTNVAKVVGERDKSIASLREAGWSVRDSHANFFWVHCPDGGRSVYERLRAEGILVRWFDEPGLSDGIRVSVGTAAEMERFLEALGAGSDGV